jgi:hypothetical protein
MIWRIQSISVMGGDGSAKFSDHAIEFSGVDHFGSKALAMFSDSVQFPESESGLSCDIDSAEKLWRLSRSFALPAIFPWHIGGRAIRQWRRAAFQIRTVFAAKSISGESLRDAQGSRIF